MCVQIFINISISGSEPLFCIYMRQVSNYFKHEIKNLHVQACIPILLTFDLFDLILFDPFNNFSDMPVLKQY